MVLSWLFSIGCYIVVARSIRGDLKEQAIGRRLRLYMFVFILVRLWSFLNRLQNWMNPDNPRFELYLLHSIFSPLQGLFNVLAYGFNQKVRQHYYLLCCGIQSDYENLNVGIVNAPPRNDTPQESFYRPQPINSKMGNQQNNSHYERSKSELSDSNSRGFERENSREMRPMGSSFYAPPPQPIQQPPLTQQQQQQQQDTLIGDDSFVRSQSNAPYISLPSSGYHKKEGH